MKPSKKIKQIRTLNNHTQQAFANLLGIDHTTFQKYETGTIPPHLELLQKICKKFPEHTLWLMIDDIGIQQYIPALKEQEVRMNAHQHLENILQYNRDGSYGTQAARADVLHQLINDLHQHGYTDFKLDKMGSR